MSSIEQAGGNIDQQLQIEQPSEVNIDILNMPWQHLKKAAMQIAINKRVRSVSVQRTHTAALKEVDIQISKKIVNSLGDKECKVYNHIASGAAWSEAHLHDIGLATSSKCSHCGEEVTDITHVTWSCPVINQHRRIEDLKSLDPQLLPAYIRHGIPAAMSGDMETTFWGQQVPEDVVQSKGETINIIGVPSTRRQKLVASSKNREVKDVLRKCNIDPLHHNARQAFQKIKANKQPPHMEKPYRCTRKPPAEINVFTDGSWTSPLHQYLGLGGAGVWWPGRIPAHHHRLSEEESNLAYARQYPQCCDHSSGGVGTCAHWYRQSGHA